LYILQGQNRPTRYVSDELMGLMQEREQGGGDRFGSQFALHITELTEGDDSAGTPSHLVWERVTAIDRMQELPWCDDRL
jgi:hypothetical protein